MDAAPWRRFSHAARWKGQAPQVTTGAVRVSASHCQFVNCSVLIIDSSSTGRPRTAEPISRPRSARSSGSSLALRGNGLRCRGRELGRVADRLDLGDEVLDRDPIGNGHARLLGGVVDAGVDAVELVEALRDAGGARGAGHPADLEVERCASVWSTSVWRVTSRRLRGPVRPDSGAEPRADAEYRNEGGDEPASRRGTLLRCMPIP